MFAAKLYGLDMPLVGQAVEAYFSSSSLVITEPAMSIHVDEISMRVGGFEHNEFLLDWQFEGSSYTLKPATPEAITQLIETAPPLLNLQFSAWHKRNFSIKFVWSSIAVALAGISIALLMLWVNYDQVLNWVVNNISIENETRLGDSVFDQLKADGDILESGIAENAVKQIGDALTTHSKYQYRWFIKQDPMVNAFALPGGIVVVNSGLIKITDNADELAAVLAHEIQHVEQRHALKNMMNSLGWAAGLMVVLGDVNIATAVIAHQLGNMYFSREKESEADRLGYQTLVAANINPTGMSAILKKLAAQPGGEVPEWLSSHPDNAARIAAIQKMEKEQPCYSCSSLQFDWDKVRSDKLLSPGQGES